MTTPADRTEAVAAAMALHGQNRLAEARAALEAIVATAGLDFQTCHMLAGIAAGQQDFVAAESWGRQALAFDPRHLDAQANQGAVLRALGRPMEALAQYDAALAVAPDAAVVLTNKANLLNDLLRWESALGCADRAIAADPGAAGAHNARGNALTGLGRARDALASYEAALQFAPGHLGAQVNRAKALLALGDAPRALAGYEAALSLDAASTPALVGRGLALSVLRRWDEAAVALDAAFARDPGFPLLAGYRLHARMKACRWDGFDALVADLGARIDRGELASAPFPMIPTPLTAAQQLRVARRFAEAFVAPPKVRTPDPRKPGPIRIGYVSADFHDHATSHLMVELIENHDRAEFQVIGLSFGPATDDPVRRRMLAAFDQIYDVRQLGDAAVAELCRGLDIDIAVDVKGFTTGSRPGIFAERAAPIQVNYLAYPMTTGAPAIDYIIADPVLIGPDETAFYSEAVAWMPACYQPNDRHRPVAPPTTRRGDHGLPEQGFVFAGFNATYKITPACFDSWMRLLRAVDGAVLWLLDDSDGVATALRREAQARGVDPARLVFAPMSPAPAHRERLRHADLFLDTVFCTAHTTASDALWAGLPVVTVRGDTFAARVAASLLAAVDLPELAVDSLEAYEALALTLARDPKRLAALRRRLTEDRLGFRLFDTPAYARGLEHLYRTMQARRLRGEPPGPIPPL